MVEIPLRHSLGRFSCVVDVEVVIQETLMRMWLVAQDPQRQLEGLNASLKFAFKVGRNVALEEMRRYRQDRLVDLTVLDGLPEGCVEPELPDPALARAIKDCVDRLPRQPYRALLARMSGAAQSDREAAAAVRMKMNTFLQNIVRARRLLADCLQKRGVRLAEIPS